MLAIFVCSCLLGLFISYATSVLVDLADHRRRQVPMRKVLPRVWSSLAVSVLARAAFIALITHLESFLVLKLHRLQETPVIGQWLITFGCALFPSLLVPAYQQRIVEGASWRVAKQKAVGKWLTVFFRVEKHLWPRVSAECEYQFQEELHSIWKEKDNRTACFILFEEHRESIVRYYCGKKSDRKRSRVGVLPLHPLLSYE